MYKRARTDIWGFLILVGFAFFVYWAYAGTGSLVVGDRPIQEINTTWNGNQVFLKSPYFGSITSTSSGDFEFCSDSNGGIKLDNSYLVGQDLVLKSSLSSTDRKRSCAGNYVEGYIILPAGTLNIDYDLSSASPYNSVAEAVLTIDGLTFRSKACESDPGCSKYASKSGSTQINITSSKKIEFSLTSSKSEVGYASSSAVLKFVPAVMPSNNSVSQVQAFTSSSSPSIFEQIQSLIRQIIDLFRGMIE